MTRHHIQISQAINKPIEEVYAWLSNHNNLGKLFKIPVARIQDGIDELNGVGSIRQLGPGPIGVQETVVAAEANRFIEYRITRFGGPVKNHNGRIDFSETDGGSLVEWTINFESFPVIGALLEKTLTQIISAGLRKNA